MTEALGEGGAMEEVLKDLLSENYEYKFQNYNIHFTAEMRVN